MPSPDFLCVGECDGLEIRYINATVAERFGPLDMKDQLISNLVPFALRARWEFCCLLFFRESALLLFHDSTAGVL